LGTPALYLSPAVSPDGKRIAVHRHDVSGGDIWIMDGGTGKTSRLTFDALQENVQPTWVDGGTSIIFGSRRNGKWGIYERRSDGTSTEQLLYESENQLLPMSWSPTANVVFFYVIDSKTGTDVWALPLEKDRKPFP